MWCQALFLTTFSVVHAARLVSIPSNDDWQRAYKELHRKRIPSPNKLAEQFARKQKAIEKDKAAQEAYLHSEEYHLTLLRRFHKDVQDRLTHRNRSLEVDKLPAESISARGLRCGDHVSAAELGLKDSSFIKKLIRPRGTFGPHALLQVGSLGGPSMAQPGAGAHQTLADNGRSVEGTVESAESGKIVEPFLMVFKDGYSYTGCFKDKMYDFGDKYGNNKDQYRQQHQNISVVHYSEVVLKEKQVAMSPKKCYEFCRTIPDMVFFGIKAGKDCYCTPYFLKGASGSENCDLPCPGDPTQMCGGLKEKSQIFEMHMCADTAGDLLYRSVHAEVELVYFYDTAFMTDKLAHQLQDAGRLLEKIGGSVGDTGATDAARASLLEAQSLFDPTTGWGECQDEYEATLSLYDEAKALYDADFTFAKKLQEAEDAMFMMENYEKDLHECSTLAVDPILAVYPFYLGFMASLDEKDLQSRVDAYGKALLGFHPIIYAIDAMAAVEMSSCSGKMLGLPKPIPLSACAEACDQTKYPIRCAAFQVYQIMDGDQQRPLCFFYEEVVDVQTYRCEMLPRSVHQGLMGALEVATSKSNSSSLRGKAPGTADAAAPTDISALCTHVQLARTYSGLSCEAIFGKESLWIDHCSEECKPADGAWYTAVCMSRLSLGRPRGMSVKQNHNCFGKDNKAVDQSMADWRLQEFGTDASGGAGPKIEGEISMGGKVVTEPYGHVWTPGPAGQR